MSEINCIPNLPKLRNMLEQIDLDLMYLLHDTQYFKDRKLACITDKIEIASMCISLAVRALQDPEVHQPAPLSASA